MNTPDLTLYYVVHRRMRESSRQLAAALATLDESDRRERGRQLVRWYGGFEGELHVHHTVEDNIFFPALFEKVPSLRGYLDRIEDEHVHLNELLISTGASLVEIANPMTSFADAVGSAVKLAAELEALLETHLDFEDAEVLPLFTRHMDGDEYKALDDKAMGKPEIGQLKFTVPWIMAGVSADEQRHLFEGAPFMMKVVWLATRRGYGRLEHAALGSVPTVELAVAS